MMKNRNILLTGILIIIIPMMIFSQEGNEQVQVSTSKKNLLVSISPQHMIKSGLRVEIEPHLTGKQWLTIAPMIYLNHSNENQYNTDYEEFEYNNTYNKLTGAGIEINHKIFLYDKDLPSGPYFAYGLFYQHVYLEYEEYVYYPDIFEGLSVERYGIMDIKHNIDKVGTGFILGYHYPVENIIFFDLYVGVGIRYSFQDKNYESNREYSGSIIDFGYTGTLPLAGFKCGFVF
ncbi:MAG: hypothetical protein JXB49_26945 [Bacteroidales bacterium]|nr:hypothetical protein [Bacteroidales bacterium]